MAYNQHEHVELGPFTGGVRFDKAREDLEPNELAYCRNGRLDAQGRLSKRPGITRQQDYSGTVHLLGEFEDTSGTRHNFAVVGAVFYGGASNQNDRTGALTVGGATTVFTNANGTAYFADGTNAGYKWAGETNNIEAWSMPTSFTKPEFVIFWDNRLWCASDAGTDEDIVWRSQAGGYETWEGSYTLGQKILALSIHQDQLLAHTETGMWQFTPTGDANTPYELEQVAARGVVAKRGVVTYSDGSSIGVFRNGIYRWEDPRRLEKVSHALDIGYWEERYGKHSGDSPANIDAVYYPTDEEVWFTFGGNSENIDVFALREIDGDWVWMGPWQYSTDVVVGSFTALGLQSSNRMRAGTDEGEIFSMDPNTAYQDAAGATIRGVALQAQTALASAEDEAQGRWAMPAIMSRIDRPKRPAPWPWRRGAIWTCGTKTSRGGARQSG